MLDIRELRRTCRTQLKTVSSLPSKNHWQGRTFDPLKAGSLWVKEKVFMNSERQSSIGFIESLGEVHYDVYTPKGKSDGDAQDLAKEIAEAFESGQSLSGGINLFRTERGVLRHEEEQDLESWSYVPVVVRWRVFTATS